MLTFLQNLSLSNALFAETAAFGAVATLGYLFGKRTRQINLQATSDAHRHETGALRAELTRAQRIASDLNEVTLRIRKELASHQTNIAGFQARMKKMTLQEDEAGWQKLSSEAELLVGPTLRIATNLSLAYDQLRKQSAQLMSFAGSRTDAATGVHNRKAMQEQLEVLFSMLSSDEGRFSFALFSLEAAGEELDPQQLSEFARLLADSARTTDFVARYSTDEFAVVMPQTSLAGAVVFSQRLLAKAAELFGRAAWGGVVETNSADTAERLLSRVDSALYSARATGQTCLFQHASGILRRVSQASATQSPAAPTSDAPSSEASPPLAAPRSTETSAEKVEPALETASLALTE